MTRSEKAFLRRRLFLPMGGAAAVCLLLAYYVQPGGIFVDLALVFLGILLTVGYVDSVLRKHEEKRWRPAEKGLHSRLEGVANATWSQFRVAFGIPSAVLPLDPLIVRDDRARRLAIIRVAEGLVGPSASECIPQLDTQAWTNLANQIRGVYTSVDRMLEIYGQRLSPVVTADLMAIQDHLDSILVSHTTFPDVLGVPDNELPPSRGHDRVAERTALENLVVKEVESAVAAAVRVLRRLDGDSSLRKS